MPVTRSTSRRVTPARTRVRRPHRRLDRHAQAPAFETRAAVPAFAADTVSARRAGGPQDFAFYACSCGAGFRAEVGISVGCPGCGAAQDW